MNTSLKRGATPLSLDATPPRSEGMLAVMTPGRRMKDESPNCPVERNADGPMAFLDRKRALENLITTTLEKIFG